MSNLQIALDHARNGYYVHPLVPRDKMPLAGGNGYNDATRDEELIRAWWARTPDANVGINLHLSHIVDIAPDCQEWAATFKANGLPRTMLYTSNSAWHTWYRLPAGGPVARACVSGQYDIMSEGNTVAPGSIHPSGKVYTLHTPLMPVEDLPVAPQWAIEMLQARVTSDRKAHTPEAWAELPSGATLAQSRRFQALVKANDQLRAVVSGEGVTLNVKGGGQDSSPSIQRAVFVNQLLRAKYPHNEIRALALHFSGVLESKPKWFKTDIDNLLRTTDQSGYTPMDYQPESTGVLQMDVAPHGGRHYEITTGEMLDGYHLHADCGVNGIALDWTQTEAADHFGVSVGTIKRREAEATAAGMMRRVVTEDRQRSYVILSVDTWDVRSQRIETPQMADKTIDNNIINCFIEAESVYSSDVRSQFDTPQQDAANSADECSRYERAHDEITHSPRSPAQPDEWAGIDAEIERWKRTTRDGRHFAQLEARAAHDMAGVERLQGILRGPKPPQWQGACVLSTAPVVPQACPPRHNAYRDIGRLNVRKPNVNGLIARQRQEAEAAEHAARYGTAEDND